MKTGAAAVAGVHTIRENPADARRRADRPADDEATWTFLLAIRFGGSARPLDLADEQIQFVQRRPFVEFSGRRVGSVRHPVMKSNGTRRTGDAPFQAAS